jgi:hypothetical protein
MIRFRTLPPSCLLLVLVGLIAGCSAASQPAGSTAAPAPSVAAPPAASAIVLGDEQTPAIPAVQREQERRQEALATSPYILLRPGLEGRLGAAQEAVVNDGRVQSAARTTTGQRLLTEVMSVTEARAGDVPSALASQCPPGSCLRVVLYVYPTNTTLTTVVDDRGEVIDVQSLADAQPEIPAELAEVATEIAISSHETAQALGLPPDAAMATMTATKTSLAGTACERSKHLCVAPVFTWGEQALWTIVDLTDLSLVAAATWTDQGSTGRRRIESEATLQDAAIAPLCENPQTIDRDGWQASYLLTSSDGLELRDVSYQGRPLLTSIKVVDWHVGYRGADEQRVGFSDAIGCPVFSAAAVIPYGLPSVMESPEGGFVLALTFRSPNWPQPCNYQYTLTAAFGQDGTLAVEAGNEGRGCGTEGVYHPIVRLEPPASSAISKTEAAEETPLLTEGSEEWAAGTDQGFIFTTAAGQLMVSPTWGDAERAFVYWSAAKEAEGQGDLPSIGTCCRLDAQQGPEAFVDPAEPLGHTPVLWYVPQISNAERMRCWADTEIDDGVLVPQVWPCGSGLTLSLGT